MPRDMVTVTTDVAAPVEVVWLFLTTGRDAWWPEMRFEAVVGSPLVEIWVEEGRQITATGRVTRCDEPRVLGFSWTERGWERPLDVVIELVANGRSTTVTLTETGFSRAHVPSALPAEHEEGWRYHLTRWQRVSEGGAAGVDAQ
ncbi:SRPBCC family protein [Cellulomonas taurus]|uniref:SRPBCC family protein n=1 Tax=Cellulomonas taurus TaxID=2729175 RepID=UPI001FE7C367|nr:SRPBCC domain-containing protein [Cellulomonas taurus]